MSTSTLRAARRGLSVALLVGAAAAGGGCSQERAERPVFPEKLQQSAVLNVQVIRDGTSITLTNTSPRALGPCRLWANRWYSYDLPGLGIGETLELTLGDFHDRYDDPFRQGGFWATDNPDKLVKMDIEEGGTLTGLIVVGGGE